MSVLQKLASSQSIKSGIPNQKLAKELADSGSQSDIKELVKNLDHKDKIIQSDCIKTLYEIGYIKPELISDYVEIFIDLLNSSNNRLIWGGMVALSTIAQLKNSTIFSHRETVIKAMEKGSVITKDAGIITLARLAATDTYTDEIFPYLIDQLKTCRPKSIAPYAESISIAVNDKHKDDFKTVLFDRKDILKPSQLRRVTKLLKQF